MLSVEEGHLKLRTLAEGFPAFKLLVDQSIIKLYAHDIPFSDICNFLITEILVFYMLFLVKWKMYQFAFYLYCRNITVISEIFFCKTVTWRLRNKFKYWWNNVNFYLDKHFPEKCFNKSNISLLLAFYLIPLLLPYY